jgi:hypothetical protein
MSEDLASVIRALTARAAAEPLALIALTDEEIAALGAGPADLGPVPLPWLAGKDQADRELACQVALRGLAARQLIAPLGPEDKPGGRRDGREYVAMHDDLRAVLAMRHSARAVICALRESDQRIRLVYLGVTGALEEAISPGGLHGFTVLAHAAVPARLAGFADPGDTAAAVAPPGRAQPRILPLAEIARGAQVPVTGARSVTMVERLVFGEAAEEPRELRLTVYEREAGVVVASPVDADGEQALEFAEVTRDELAERIAALLPALELADSGQ